MNGSQERPTTPPVAPAETVEAPATPPAAQQAPPPGIPVPPPGGFFQTPPSVARDPRAKSPALACVLSLMPGLGQVYTGYYMRGFAYITTVAAIITLIATGDMDELTPFLALFMAFFWLYNCIDAGRRATFYNQMLAGGTDADMFAPEMKMPGTGGSLLAGIGLIVVGILALSYTKFDMSLTWLEDWWPVIPIGVGLYLIVVNVIERMK